MTDRLEQAQRAYAEGDYEASAAAHDPQRIREAAEEHGSTGHQYIGDLVYGGLDGIITTFAVVSGVAGASLSTAVVLILGLANLFADGLSMAVGAYLSSKSEREYYEREREREAWEVENFPEGERVELIEIYREKGYSQADADNLVEIQTRSDARWVDAMMIHELGMLPDERKPLLSGLATLIAFVVAGAVPLLVYLLGGQMLAGQPETAFALAALLSGVALFGLGAAKVLITERNWMRAGLEMLIVGGLAGAVAYLVGYLLRSLGVSA